MGDGGGGGWTRQERVGGEDVAVGTGASYMGRWETWGGDRALVGDLRSDWSLSFAQPLWVTWACGRPS